MVKKPWTPMKTVYQKKKKSRNDKKKPFKQWIQKKTKIVILIIFNQKN